MKTRLLLVVAAISALAAASCNTMKGLGTDVQRAGGAIQSAASQ